MEATRARARAAEETEHDDIFDSYCYVVGLRIQDGLSDTLEQLSRLPDASWLGWAQVLECMSLDRRGMTVADVRSHLWKVKKEAEARMDDGNSEEEDPIEEPDSEPASSQDVLQQLRAEEGWDDAADVLLEPVEMEVRGEREGSRGRRAAEREFRLHFPRYGSDDDTWERESKMQKCRNAKAAIERFEARKAAEDRISSVKRIQQLDSAEPRTQEEHETPVDGLLGGPVPPQPEQDVSTPLRSEYGAVACEEARLTGDAECLEEADEEGGRDNSREAGEGAHSPEGNTVGMVTERGTAEVPPPSPATPRSAAAAEPTGGAAQPSTTPDEQQELVLVEHEFRRHLSAELWELAVVKDVIRDRRTNFVFFDVTWPSGFCAEICLNDLQQHPHCALKLLRFLLDKETLCRRA
mmetsp:Transcript_19803/g.55039  ORF Transcript_19803/g.55039 Transcript_19803/m.55039 type:complete len:409 (+) Transcript_19803:59-1285(+)